MTLNFPCLVLQKKRSEKLKVRILWEDELLMTMVFFAKYSDFYIISEEILLYSEDFWCTKLMILTPYWKAIPTSALLTAAKRSVFFSLTWHEKLQKDNSWIQSRNAGKLLKLWTDKLYTEFFQCKSFQGIKCNKIKK